MTKLSLSSFKKRMAALKLPEGFTAEYGEDVWGMDSSKSVRPFYKITNGKVELKFDIDGPGHTRFLTDSGSWLTFDRRGVEDSFYWLPLYEGDERADLNTILAGELAKIAKRLDYHRTAVKIPDVGYTIAPDGVDKLKARLRTKGVVSFHPSGFGTGYNVVRKTTRKHGVRRAKPELEAFFGMSPLYVESFDAD